MNKIIHPLMLAITLCNHNTFSMEPEQKTHILIIPGQNGWGGGNVTTVIPYFEKNPRQAHSIKTPLILPDLGQNRCQNYLKNKINKLKDKNILHNNDPMIIHASSQGTATAINYVAKNPENIKCLILESVMLSGNSAIKYNIDKMFPILEFLPRTYYIAPCLARPAQFPCYSPTGEQPVNTVYNLPKDFLTIIVHNPSDPQLSCEDARALYAFLTKIKKNKNVYLFDKDYGHGEHLFLLGKENKKEITAINSILKLQNLLPSNPEEKCLTLDELKAYQPEAQQEWLDHFYNIHNKEHNLTYTYIPTQIVTIAIFVYALRSYLHSYLGI